MRSVVLCASLTAVLWPSGAGAQSQTLTEAEALARLSPESPRVRAIRSTVDVARADVLAAGRWPNPRVTFDRESAAGVTENITMFTQALPLTGRRGLDIQSAAALVDATVNRADDALRRARADLLASFADLVSAQVREREFAASESHLRDLAEALAKREAAGDAAGFDRLRAERELVEAATDLASARIDRARAQAALAGFLGGPMDAASLVANPSLSSRLPVPDVDALVNQAESSRGDLVAFSKEVEAAQFSIRAAERRRLPEPELVVGTKSSTAGGAGAGSVFAIHATVPLFDRNASERAAAAARGNLALARADALRMSIRSEVAALRAAVTERRAMADAYRARAVDNAATIERIAQVSYEAGERTILELLDAYRIGTAARVRQAELDAAVRRSEIELEFVSGWEMR